VFNGMHRYFATLVRIDGFRVREQVVNHRPRIAGVAKYGFWNRVFKVLVDLLALRWMQMRAVGYQADEVQAPVR
jgi:dolichol-phosphate mannosyltransferase